MIAVSFLLLMLVFRSIAVPLKAAVMNLLSIGAAYGVLVAVFQWGWGAELLGLDGPTPITSIIVVIMFPILFGLSMDYEVFLLSRIREEYDRTGDNTESVARGLAGTGRVVTSAALIMVAVFSSFVFSPIPSLKMLGLGLAVAILIDATIVRMVLVPATMALLGKANWWLPAWLDRILPHLVCRAPRPGPADHSAERDPVQAHRAHRPLSSRAARHPSNLHSVGGVLDVPRNSVRSLGDGLRRACSVPGATAASASGSRSSHTLAVADVPRFGNPPLWRSGGGAARHPMKPCRPCPP